MGFASALKLLYSVVDVLRGVSRLAKLRQLWTLVSYDYKPARAADSCASQLLTSPEPFPPDGGFH